MNSFQTKLRFSDLLKEKDPKLHESLEAIRRKGLEEWVPLLNFDRGSHSGYPHLLNVEQNANKMIPDKIKMDFSSGELYLLLAAIFLHDIGRIGAKERKDGGSQELGHNERSFNLIQEFWAELGLPDERIASYCAYICYYHGVGNPFDSNLNIGYFENTSLEPYGFLRIPFLSAILRYADEAENCWKRTLQEYLFEQIKNSNIPLFKGVRRFIEDVEFCHRGQCIIFHVPADFYFENKLIKSDGKQMDIPSNNLNLDVLNTLNNFAVGLRKVLNSPWNSILYRESLYFRDVYFEYRNQLYTKFETNQIEIKSQKLADIIQEAKSESENTNQSPNINTNRTKQVGLEEILDGIIRLYLGSLQHKSFTWHVLEAEIGRPVGDREKWLVSRMNAVDQNRFWVSMSTEGYEIINLDIDNVNDIKKQFGYQHD